jgi:TPR repeat protein
VYPENDWTKDKDEIHLDFVKKPLSESKRDILATMKQQYCFETPLKLNEMKDYKESYEKSLKHFEEMKINFLADLTVDQSKGTKESNEAFALLGKMPKDDKEKRENNQKFIEKMKIAAKFGNLEAQNLLVDIFASPNKSQYYSTNVDANESIYYLKLACLLNEDVVSLSKLAEITENEQEKLSYFTRSASKGFPVAMFELGSYFYEKGMYNEALVWFTCGFHRGHGLKI